MEPFQYLYNPGGLNNQKWALFGLFLAGFAAGRPIVLPDFCVLDPARGTVGRVALDQVFARAPLLAMARAYGIVVADRPPGGEPGGWAFFEAGTGFAGRLNLEGRFGTETLSCDFFGALQPVIRTAPAFLGALAGLQRVGVATAAQFRIERDWMEHVAHNLSGDPGAADEQNRPGHGVILDKIAATLGPVRVLAVWDAADLPVPVAEVKADAAARGIGLVTKAELVPEGVLAGLHALDRSLLDFELARAMRRFVGLSRSTFANLLAFETARTGRGPDEHFIYNNAGPALARRWDRGSCADAVSASDPVQARVPLLAVPHATPGLSLVAAVAGLGDVWNHDWLGVSSTRGIEGVGLIRPTAGRVTLAVRGLLPDGRWTAWAEPGGFVGARGGGALLGFAARMAAGPPGWTLRCLGQFAGVAGTVEAADGVACRVDPPAPLTGLQLVVSAG